MFLKFILTVIINNERAKAKSDTSSLIVNLPESKPLKNHVLIIKDGKVFKKKEKRLKCF